MKFEDFDKMIQDVPHKVLKDWDIELPYDTNFQPIIAKARECGVTTWHVIVGSVTEKNPKPVTSMYWDDRRGKGHNEDS